MCHFTSNKICYSNKYCQGIVEVIYSRFSFKVIKYFATSPNFKEARKQFHYESGKPKALQKQTTGSKYYLTIPPSVKIIYDNRIDFNENRYVFKDLNKFPQSDYWFPYEYIDAEVNKN